MSVCLSGTLCSKEVPNLSLSKVFIRKRASGASIELQERFKSSSEIQESFNLIVGLWMKEGKSEKGAITMDQIVEARSYLTQFHVFK